MKLQKEVWNHRTTLVGLVTAMVIKNKLVTEQVHSLLELKCHNNKVAERNQRIEKLLQQLSGRKSERRLDGVGQLLLDMSEEAFPEVVNSTEEAI